jgi:hypothetical protein
MNCSPIAHRTPVHRFKHTPKMPGCSPLDAHPLPGTSRFLTTERDLCVPPPYKAQQAPPPYSSDESNTKQTTPSTRSVPFGSNVTFEWSSQKPRSPDDIIIVTVRVNTQGRRQSFDDPLPERYAYPTRSYISPQHILTTRHPDHNDAAIFAVSARDLHTPTTNGRTCEQSECLDGSICDTTSVMRKGTTLAQSRSRSGMMLCCSLAMVDISVRSWCRMGCIRMLRCIE